MSSEVYFRFKASIKTDTIPFDGSAISVKDLKNAIKTKCCLRTNDFELKLEDNSGKGKVVPLISFQNTLRTMNGFPNTQI